MEHPAELSIPPTGICSRGVSSVRVAAAVRQRASKVIRRAKNISLIASFLQEG
jgi:hypothetical protein